MGRYRLTPAAQKDLEEIWTYTNDRQGIERTLDYIDSIEAACVRLSEMPRMCRERHEYAPPVRIHPHREHLIVYVLDEENIDAVRILHARMDLDASLAPGR